LRSLDKKPQTPIILFSEILLQEIARIIGINTGVRIFAPVLGLKKLQPVVSVQNSSRFRLSVPTKSSNFASTIFK